MLPRSLLILISQYEGYCEAACVKPFVSVFGTYGSPAKPLRRYIALADALERVLQHGRDGRAEGQRLRLSLVRTWLYYVVRAVNIERANIIYIEREDHVPFSFGYPDRSEERRVGKECTYQRTPHH